MLKQLLNAFKSLPAVSKHVKLTEVNNCAIFSLDRPPVNAINLGMYQTFYHYLRHFEANKSHIIVKGEGKFFSAGGDVKIVIASDIHGVKDIFAHQLKGFEVVSTYKKPFIALMHGVTMGGVSPLSIAGKYRVATENTVYAMPETAIGFFNDAGASYFLGRLSNNVGVFLGMTGHRLTGVDMLKTGLATHYVQSERLSDLEKSLIECKNEDEIKLALAKHSSDVTPTEFDDIVPKIDRTFDGDTVEEIYGNLHLEGSDWAMKTIRVLNKMSPTSLKVTHRSITNGRNLSLEDCLRTEFRLAINHVFLDSDFKEGTRAVLVDKDNNPKWNPAKIQDVTPEIVDKFFQPIPGGEAEDLKFESR